MAAVFFDPRTGSTKPIEVEEGLRACLISLDELVHRIAALRGIDLSEPPPAILVTCERRDRDRRVG